MPNVQLYYLPKTCSFVSQALLQHLRIPHTATLMRRGDDGIEAADGTISHQVYLSINPSGLVPALRITESDGSDNVVLETPALLNMIARLAPDKNQGLKLLGVTNLEKAHVVEWCTWLSGTLHATGFRAFWRPDKFVGDNKAAYDAILAKGREKIGECFERIETRVKGRKHAVGEDLSIVDFYLYLFWHWGIAAEFDIMGDYTGYRNVLLQIEALQGVRNAMHQNGFEVCVGNNQASR